MSLLTCRLIVHYFCIVCLHVWRRPCDQYDKELINSLPPLLVDTAPNVTLRLVGGSDSSRGRLEVYHDGRWGTVCDDDWDIKDGQVACLQMGFGAAVEVILKGGSRGLRGRDPIWLDNVECTGLEDNIADCEHNGWGVTDCTHFEDAGLVCIGKYVCKMSLMLCTVYYVVCAYIGSFIFISKHTCTVRDYVYDTYGS